MTPGQEYQQRIERFAGERSRIAKESRRLSQLRLAAFLAAVILAVLAFDLRIPALNIAAILLFIAFIALVVRHARLRRAQARLDALLQLNREGLLRLDRNWAELPARRALSDLREHAYGDDLDLFGRAALAQLLGGTSTVNGHSTLEAWLLQPGDPAEIPARQAAVHELADRIDWRDELSFHARLTERLRPGDLHAFLSWAERPGWLSTQPMLLITAWLLPAVTIALMVLDVWLATTSLWALTVLLTALLSWRALPLVHRTFAAAFAREGMLAHYPELLRCVGEAMSDANTPQAEEQEASFPTGLLNDLQQRLRTDGVPAHEALRKLERLMHLADLRFSTLHYPIQLLTLSDIHVLHALERWQRRYGHQVREWLHAVGIVEALAALATLAHDEPEWTYPVIAAGANRVEAELLGHPLLSAEQRVSNSVTLGPAGTFLFVTGSNMSGKSTLLRAIGMNIVLAQAGAPVCARSFRLPPVELRTAIRVQDSLSRGVSYFMAELQRLRSVVDAATSTSPSADRTVVYLLDEVLHGTNSAERQIAGRQVIRRLVDLRALGAVTSHDLDLVRGGELEDAAQLVHFREHFHDVDGQVRMEFDYILRPGLATTTNALRLLELVGLRLS